MAEQPIHLYMTGDEDGPDIFAVIYDDEDEALEVAHENEVRVWRVPVIPQLDQAVDVTPDEEDGDA